MKYQSEIFLSIVMKILFLNDIGLQIITEPTILLCTSSSRLIEKHIYINIYVAMKLRRLFRQKISREWFNKEHVNKTKCILLTAKTINYQL